MAVTQITTSKQYNPDRIIRIGDRVSAKPYSNRPAVEGVITAVCGKVVGNRYRIVYSDSEGSGVMDTSFSYITKIKHMTLT